MVKIKLTKDLFEHQVIEQSLLDFKDVFVSKIGNEGNYYIVEFPNEQIAKEFENYVIDLTNVRR